jgi:protein ImuA
MATTKANIIAQLKKDILPLQGFKHSSHSTTVDIGLRPIKDTFPNGSFPLGAIHEFICADAEASSASGGFIAGILTTLMQDGGVCLWISSSRTLFPPALKSFGIAPDKIIFIDLQKQSDILWAMEEALKCDGLAAVVGEMQDLNFTASRRLQLTVEQSRVTGFILRCNPRHLNTTACITRWKINSLASVPADDMPGIGFPRWNVELLKVRNGKPGTWQIEWAADRFRYISRITSMPEEQHKKTG